MTDADLTLTISPLNGPMRGRWMHYDCWFVRTFCHEMVDQDQRNPIEIQGMNVMAIRPSKSMPR